MKGLVIKDLMCMKKNIITFVTLMVAVIILSVMFVCSYRFGNLAVASAQLMNENDWDTLDVRNLYSFVLVLFMFLPLAQVGDFTVIYMEDRKSGFAKVSSVLPINIERRVLAKYLTIFLLFAIGISADLVLAFAVSRMTDMVNFAEFFGIIVAAAAVISMYGSLVILYAFVFPKLKIDWAQTMAYLTLVFVPLGIYVLTHWNKVVEAFTREEQPQEQSHIPDFFAVLKDKYIWFVLVAVVVWGVSYILSVWSAKRNRGII